MTALDKNLPDENEPVLKPGELLAWRKANGHLKDFPAPRTVIFTPQASLAEYVLRRHPSREMKGFLGRFHLLKRSKGRVALSTGFGIGAPVLAGLADEFTALGVRQFVLIGLAGSLQPGLGPGSLVVSTGAIPGEGVSRHYVPARPMIEADAALTAGIHAALTRRGHLPALGTTWTTDAPYRERRRDVLEYQRQGVLAVDMEAAGLLAVAASMGLAAGALFAIVDQLSDGRWRMSGDPRSARMGLSILFDAVYEFLSSKEK